MLYNHSKVFLLFCRVINRNNPPRHFRILLGVKTWCFRYPWRCIDQECNLASEHQKSDIQSKDGSENPRHSAIVPFSAVFVGMASRRKSSCWSIWTANTARERTRVCAERCLSGDPQFKGTNYHVPYSADSEGPEFSGKLKIRAWPLQSHGKSVHLRQT